MRDIGAISSGSHISDEGVKSLGEALVENDSLKKLWLAGSDGVSEKGLSVLTECILYQGKQRIG